MTTVQFHDLYLPACLSYRTCKGYIDRRARDSYSHSISRMVATVDEEDEYGQNEEGNGHDKRAIESSSLRKRHG